MRDKPDVDPALEGLPPLIPGKVVARDIFHVSPRTLRRWVAAGKLHALRTSAADGGRFLFRREEVSRFIRTLEGREM